MMRKQRMAYAIYIVLVCILTSCKAPETSSNPNSYETLNNVERQMGDLLDTSIAANKIPRSEEEDGDIMWATKTTPGGDMRFDWTLGFFPGSCWYLYEATGDNKWKEAAETFQGQFAPFQHFRGSHDLGFVFYCSYGNGLRVSRNEQYKAVLIEAGNTLLTRFNPTVGCLQSWDVSSGWQAERGWKYPVIIDNMMNLEMLFELTALTGNPRYREVAISHANKTLAHHFRPDHSSYHVLDYDPETGAVRKKCTAQGYADESAWARGQAWGLYGFVVSYRYTRDPRYLEQAIRIADFITRHPNLPADGVPYWDYNAPNIPEEPRDVSAAAIAASALIELNTYTDDQYKAFVHRVMGSLASEKYSVPSGGETKFVLDHSVGSIPHGSEIDQPLVYADYYFIEALIRMQKANQTSPKELSRS